MVERVVYLFPRTPKGHFNIQMDKALCEKGSHFFCQGHLSAVPIEEQSRNIEYCSECYASIKEQECTYEGKRNG
ncbi:hypothetical protein LCGC14_0365950 [marine sediment metagenome]|uniref:Uncharacterized protein n=1 Tax=marine sediment metagenome TaxID=412755 RepID=A0A0F9WF89_9ZZZZ